MVNYYSSPLDRTFAALADPTRRAILARLARGETTVGELARPFQVSLPAVSKHLRVLERAGLLRQEKEGRVRRCRLEAGPMGEAADWIERYRDFWEGRLEALAEYLKDNQGTKKEERACPPPPRRKSTGSRSEGASRRPARRSSRHGPRRKR
jgi:DNA-binding transcriptional ArsR family regulator